MSNYYEYRRVGVKIAHRLMRMNGWKVYGYSPDRSDFMTDYYDPACWVSGTAEKNGYVFVFNNSFESKGRSYEESKTVVVYADEEKIRKLERMTVDRGASEQEEETAKRKIAEIRRKAEEVRKETTETVIYELPHMANPPRCSWHIEKDGVIIDKGTGLLKFSDVYDLANEYDQKRWQEYNNMSEEEWKKDYIRDLTWHYSYYSEEQAARQAERAYKDTQEAVKKLEAFNRLINRIDTTCGGMIGKEGQEYKKVKKTVYKKENKAYEMPTGEIKTGQHFILKSNFNYGCSKGNVYEIRNVYVDADGKPVSFSAYKLNGKLNKLCMGYGNRSNYFGTDVVRLNKWIEKGNIAFCEIREEKVPYEVEKLVKVKKNA